ncbi:zinc carboxypeptidase-like [Scylla paramamosain]|uniref:zinc carboxypeptidase-like n=1 Tax=Scylla paramamosain TaxID=85552 RepID=UPI00308274A8
MAGPRPSRMFPAHQFSENKITGEWRELFREVPYLSDFSHHVSAHSTATRRLANTTATTATVTEAMAWMWHQWLVLIVVVVARTAGNSLPQPDNNYQVLAGQQVWEAEGQEAMKVLADLEMEGLADILGHSSSTPRFRVHADNIAQVAAALTEAGLTQKLLISDLARHVMGEQRKESLEFLRGSRTESCTEESCPKPLANAYMSFEQIEYYLRELAERSQRVELVSIGKSIEGRDIWRVHIRPYGDTGEDVRRNAVWFEAGIHAREWISPATACHLLEYLVADKSLTKNLDVYMVPMANPDGYEFSRTNDRFWRKNRRINAGSSCSGVDLNRNWDESFGVGASSNPCSEVYKGTKPFSEPETEALSAEMQRVNSVDDLRLMISLHSYGQVLLYPWGSTTNNAPKTPMMKRVGKRFSKGAIKSYKTKYTVENAAAGMYLASGSTDDWAKAALKVPLSYTLELRDKGRNGFVLPASQILPTSEEVWNGIKKMFFFINKKF